MLNVLLYILLIYYLNEWNKIIYFIRTAYVYDIIRVLVSSTLNIYKNVIIYKIVGNIPWRKISGNLGGNHFVETDSWPDYFATESNDQYQ